MVTEAEQVFTPKPIKQPKPKKAKEPTPVNAGSKPVKKATAKKTKHPGKPIAA